MEKAAEKTGNLEKKEQHRNFQKIDSEKIAYVDERGGDTYIECLMRFFQRMSGVPVFYCLFISFILSFWLKFFNLNGKYQEEFRHLELKYQKKKNNFYRYKKECNTETSPDTRQQSCGCVTGCPDRRSAQGKRSSGRAGTVAQQRSSVKGRKKFFHILLFPGLVQTWEKFFAFASLTPDPG